MCTQRSPDNINVEIGTVVYTKSPDTLTSKGHPDNINVEIGTSCVGTKVTR